MSSSSSRTTVRFDHDERVCRCHRLGPRSPYACAQVEVSKYATYVQRKVYLFHRVFSESTQQRQLYRQSIKPLVLKVMMHCLRGGSDGVDTPWVFIFLAVL